MERQIIVNEGFGSRCNLCGHFFDDGDYCNNGHERGAVYEKKDKAFIRLEGTEAEKFLLKFEEEKKEKEKALAEENAKKSLKNICPYCGAYLDDDDDVCPRGHVRIF